RPERLAVCLDTCHLFAAGYDVRTRKGWDAVVRKIDSLIGLGQVVAFHLNDSKTELGSRVDRHAHIGQGKIGLGSGNEFVISPSSFVSKNPGYSPHCEILGIHYGGPGSL